MGFSPDHEKQISRLCYQILSGEGTDAIVVEVNPKEVNSGEAETDDEYVDNGDKKD